MMQGLKLMLTRDKLKLPQARYFPTWLARWASKQNTAHEVKIKQDYLKVQIIPFVVIK